jgi:uncharacterized protein (DUF2384 family)
MTANKSSPKNPAPLRRLARAIDAQIRHSRRCRARLRYLDAATGSTGMRALGSATTLAQWLCAPARSLGDKAPLMVMHTARGRQAVAQTLVALEQGVYQ